MIIHILIAQRQRVNALRQQVLNTELAALRFAMIHETLRKPREHAAPALDFAQQQRPRVARHLTG